MTHSKSNQTSMEQDIATQVVGLGGAIRLFFMESFFKS